MILSGDRRQDREKNGGNSKYDDEDDRRVGKFAGRWACSERFARLFGLKRQPFERLTSTRYQVGPRPRISNNKTKNGRLPRFFPESLSVPLRTPILVPFRSLAASTRLQACLVIAIGKRGRRRRRRGSCVCEKDEQLLAIHDSTYLRTPFCSIVRELRE